MESTKCEKERLAQKCHDLEMQLNLMKEEKSNLSGAVLGYVLYLQLELPNITHSAAYVILTRHSRLFSFTEIVLATAFDCMYFAIHTSKDNKT